MGVGAQKKGRKLKKGEGGRRGGKGGCETVR